MKSFATVILFQIFGFKFRLTMRFLEERVVRGVGNSIGIFIEADPKSFDGEWKVYVRIRVSLDIRKPLRPRMKVKKPGEEWYWVNYKYESLPTFCYFCGKHGCVLLIVRW